MNNDSKKTEPMKKRGPAGISSSAPQAEKQGEATTLPPFDPQTGVVAVQGEATTLPPFDPQTGVVAVQEEKTSLVPETPAQPTSKNVPVAAGKHAQPAASQDFYPYQILECVGEGGMGAVYKAVHTRLSKTVALKAMTGFASEIDLKRFEKEAKLAAKLSHPNIVAVHDVNIEHTPPYLVMDFVEGETIAHLIHRKGESLSILEVLKIVKAIAEGLHHAHTQGIIHRDVKPANIILDKAGVPKIMDFGLAKGLNDESEEPLTQKNLVVGTPQYMAPEQIEKAIGALSPLTDVYSLGIVFYEMLTGTIVIKAESTASAIYQVLQYKPKPPHKMKDHIPENVSAVCMKALAKKPEDRYPSSLAFAQALDNEIKALEKGRHDVRTSSSQGKLVLAAMLLLAAAAGLFLLRPGNPSQTPTKLTDPVVIPNPPDIKPERPQIRVQVQSKLSGEALPATVTIDKSPVDQFIWRGAGNYAIEIRHHGYKTLTAAVDLSGKDEQLSFLLEAKPCLLKLATTPSVEDSKAILTDLATQKQLLFRNGMAVDPGNYMLVVAPIGYCKVQENVTVSIGEEEKTVALALVATEVAVSLRIQYDVTPPQGAPGYQARLVNTISKQAAKIQDGDKVLPGVYQLQIRQPGYQNVGKEVQIGAGVSYAIEEKLLAKPRPFSFQIVDAASGKTVEAAEIYIDGKRILATDNWQPGKMYQLKVTFADFQPLALSLQLEAGEGAHQIKAALTRNEKPKQPVTPPVTPVTTATTTAATETFPPKDYRHPVDQAEMVLIPAGVVVWQGKEERLPAYYIDRYEVSWKQYKAFCQAAGYPLPDVPPWVSDNHPACCVSWKDVVAYCQWAGKKLPSDLQWIKAAQGGLWLDGDEKKSNKNPLPSRVYPWGNEKPDGVNKLANFKGQNEVRYAAPSKSFDGGLSPYGCYHMAGNVAEWIRDRSLRGGSWSDRHPSLLEIRHKTPVASEAVAHPFVGFRCVIEDISIVKKYGEKK